MKTKTQQHFQINSRLSIDVINNDHRGSISAIIRNNQEQGLFFETLAFRARGGEYSTEDKYAEMLEGRGFWVFIRNGKKEFVGQEVNERLTIPAGVPHLFVALEDSLFLRWFKSGGSGKDKNTYYPALRQYIDEPEKIKSLVEEYEKSRNVTSVLRS